MTKSPKKSATKTDLSKAVLIAQKLADMKQYNRLHDMYPLTGKYSRDGYKKQWEFFAQGKFFMERALMGGNQVGKTTTGGSEVAYHLTGLYPEGWPGKRWDRPTRWSVYAVTSQQLRDASGNVLLGDTPDGGTGLIPKDCIVKVTHMQGSGSFLDRVTVKHVSGGTSICYFATHPQGREAIQGKTLDGVWFDEEPPTDIYTEGIIRTVASGQKEDGSDAGMIILTFTPLKGLSEVALKFLPHGRFPSVFKDSYVTQLTWDDVPHLTQFAKTQMLKKMSPLEIEARTKGIPVAGSGAVYPISENAIEVTPFIVPEEWPKTYAFDISMKRSAVVFLTQDPRTQTYYIYDTIVADHSDFMSISNQIKQKGGDWMWGTCESKNSNWESRQKYWQIYKEEYKLNLRPANQSPGSVALGIAKVYNWLSSGKLKVFSHLKTWFAEKNLYHYEEDPGSDGRPVPHAYFNDLMDCTRYLCDTGTLLLRVNPDWDDESVYAEAVTKHRNPITGY